MGLNLLAARRVPVTAVRPVMAGDEAIEFRDGTVLQLDVRGADISLERLFSRHPGQVCLSSVVPISGRCWYRLQFSPALESVVVLARVDRFESTMSCYFRVRSRVRSRSSRCRDRHIGQDPDHF